MGVKTLYQIEQEVNAFFTSDACKALLDEYHSKHICKVPTPMYELLKGLNEYIAEICPNISIYVSDGEHTSDLLHTKDFMGMLLKYKLPNGEDAQEYIGFMFVEQEKSATRRFCADGSNLKVRFEDKYVYEIKNGGFYTHFVKLTIDDVINKCIQKRKQEILCNIKRAKKANVTEINLLQKQVLQYNKTMEEVKGW